MHYFVAIRACLRFTIPFVVSVAVAPAAFAATPPPADFAVSATQMQALGVTVTKLTQPGEIRGMSFPAKVVVPPQQEQIVSTPVSGVVDQLLVADQQSVKAGQVLLRLNSPQYGELQLKLLEAVSKSRLSKKTLERERQLFAEGIIPERRVQEADANVQGDQARVEQAQSALRLAGIDAATIRRIAETGVLLDGLAIRAKSAGRVLAIDVKPGQRVREADPLVRVVNLDQLWLDVQLPAERQAQVFPKTGLLRVVGRDVTAEPQSMAAMVSDGQTVTLRARVAKGTALLRPGEMVQVEVPFVRNVGAWALPLQAVARVDDRAYVFVRTGKGFIARAVNVVSSAEQSVQVTGDLATGQEVAVSSVIALKAAWQAAAGGK